MAESKIEAKSTESLSVEETIKRAPGIDPGNIVTSSSVQSTTTRTPAEADKTSLPNAMDAKSEAPPVRASKPDTPIAQPLAAGAGAHMPPDPAEFDSEGRPRSVSGEPAPDEAEE